jgi:hypothetical protein
VATKTQEQAIRNYLTVLNNPDALRKNDRHALETKVKETGDPVARLRLRAQLEGMKRPDTSRYEAAFVKHAKAWAEEQGVSADAFRAEGVSPAVLRKAGFAVRGTKPRRARARRQPGTHRVNADHVRRAIPRGKFTVKDLQRASGASTAVVRRVLQEELEAETITKAGSDPKHKGPGRAATIYQRK